MNFSVDYSFPSSFSARPNAATKPCCLSFDVSGATGAQVWARPARRRWQCTGGWWATRRPSISHFGRSRSGRKWRLLRLPSCARGYALSSSSLFLVPLSPSFSLFLSHHLHPLTVSASRTQGTAAARTEAPHGRLAGRRTGSQARPQWTHGPGT